MLSMAFNLQEGVKAKFEADRERMGFTHPIIGLHVRRGDKCRKGSRLMPPALCASSAPFLDAARRLREEYGVKAVFIATDDPSVITDCRRSRDFKCLAFEDDTRGMNSVSSKQPHSSRSGYVTQSILRDMDTLAMCDFFVGAIGHTGVSRIAYELLAGRRNGHVPFVSFGSWAWGMKGFA
jgi:glycoprotein 6-alpha-L-fucosyltransferase